MGSTFLLGAEMRGTLGIFPGSKSPIFCQFLGRLLYFLLAYLYFKLSKEFKKNKNLPIQFSGLKAVSSVCPDPESYYRKLAPEPLKLTDV